MKTLKCCWKWLQLFVYWTGSKKYRCSLPWSPRTIRNYCTIAVTYFTTKKYSLFLQRFPATSIRKDLGVNIFQRSLVSTFKHPLLYYIREMNQFNFVTNFFEVDKYLISTFTCPLRNCDMAIPFDTYITIESTFLHCHAGSTIFKWVFYPSSAILNSHSLWAILGWCNKQRELIPAQILLENFSSPTLHLLTITSSPAPLLI